MDTKSIALTAVFAAITVALNPAFSKIAVPAPFFPFLSYQIWEIPIVVAFLLIGYKSGVAVTLINGAILLSFLPNVITFGDVVACLSMLLGIYLAYRLITRKVPKEETLSRRKSVLSYTALGIVFRILIMVIFDYTLLRYPIIGLNLPESIIIAIIPPIALFNATEPLYTIPLGYFIAKTVGKNLKTSNKF
jgi:riboflavin transporter FmnP